MQLYQDQALQEAHTEIFIQNRSALPSLLPPGIEQDEFNLILQRLQRVVGEANVHTGENLLNFNDPFGSGDKHTPCAAICPGTVEEIQGVFAVANKFKLPLWVTSGGKNLGYGGAAPIVQGSAVLSLYRMNRILEVNEESGYAVVEPGVTFYELSQYCIEKAPSIWPSVTYIAWGSVIGNTLDRGFGYSTTGEHHHHIGGMEVVLPNGELLRTGQWAANDCPAAHVCKNSFGPQLDGLFLQSNLGVVTKMAIWLPHRPEAYMSLVVHADAFDDFPVLIDALVQLRREEILQNDPLVGNIIGGASAFIKKSNYQTEPGPLTDENIERIKKDLGVGEWAAVFDYYGPKVMVEARFSRTQKVIMERLPTARIVSNLFDSKDGVPLDNRAIAAAGGRGEAIGIGSLATRAMIPWSLPPTGRHAAHGDLVPILPQDGKLAFKWICDAKKLIIEHGFDPMIGGHVFKKHLIIPHMQYYDSDDPADIQKMNDLWTALQAKAKEYKFTNYRAHIDHMDEVQDTFDFNNHAYKRFVQSLKSKLDPNGVLSAGKQGIWPLGQEPTL